MPEALEWNLTRLDMVSNTRIGRRNPIAAFAIPVTLSALHDLGANRFFPREVVHSVRDPFVGENAKPVCGVKKDCYISKDEVFN